MKKIRIDGIEKLKKRFEDVDFHVVVDVDALETEIAKIAYADLIPISGKFEVVSDLADARLFESLPDHFDFAIKADLASGDKGFYWDNGTARYRDKSTGRLVAEKTILGLGEGYVKDVVKPRIDRHTDRFVNGDIELQDWQQRVQRELKDGWTIQSVIGRGGIKQMAPADWGRLGGRLNFEYRRLAGFAQEIANGSLTIGKIKFRVNLYINAVRTGFYDGLTSGKQAAGFTHERRRLNPAEHCVDCVGYAARGWQPIGSLPKPGTESQCQRNCKCTMEYRKGAPDQDDEPVTAIGPDGLPVGGSDSTKPIPWSPSMTKEQADQWAKDSKLRDPLYHGTTAEGFAAIPKEGFDLSRVGTGRMFGDGVYMATRESDARSYGNALETRVNLQKPFVAKSAFEMNKATDNAMKWYKETKQTFDLVSYNDVLTRHLKNQGYDGVIVEQKRTVVAFDKKSVVVVEG